MNEPVVNYWLVTQRKPLEDVVPHRLVRWFLRWIFKHYGFAARDHNGQCYASIEYRGVFREEGDARWAARCPGGAVKPIPFNSALPEETVQYGVGDVPLSEASQFYRKGVRLPFVAVHRAEVRNQLGELEELDSRLSRLNDCIEGTCART